MKKYINLYDVEGRSLGTIELFPRVVETLPDKGIRKGDLVFNLADNATYFWDGTDWVLAAGVPSPVLNKLLHPYPKEITYTTPAFIDTTTYDYLSRLLFVERIGKLMLIYSESPERVSNERRIVYRLSDDFGKTWGSAKEIYNSPYDDRLGGAMYLRTGRILLFIASHVVVGGAVDRTDRIGVIYSDDGGKTWSDFYSFPKDPALKIFSIYSNPVWIKDRLIIPWYGVDTNLYRIYVIFSDDFGKTWKDQTLVAEKTTTLSEACIQSLGEGSLIILARQDTTTRMRQFVSVDFGETWTDLGDTNHPLKGYHSPDMIRYKHENKDIIVLYAKNVPDGRIERWWAFADDLRTSATLWRRNVTSATLVQAVKLGYATVLNLGENILGAYAEEKTSTDADLYFFTERFELNRIATGKRLGVHPSLFLQLTNPEFTFLGTNQNDLDGEIGTYGAGIPANVSTTTKELTIIGGSATAAGNTWLYWHFPNPCRRCLISVDILSINAAVVAVEFSDGDASGFFNPPDLYQAILFIPKTAEDFFIRKQIGATGTTLAIENVDLNYGTYYRVDALLECINGDERRLVIFRDGVIKFDYVETEPAFPYIYGVRVRVGDDSTLEAQSGKFKIRLIAISDFV